jgi:predicted  nucleic acid-binding Zn-ribbon protein
MNTHACIKCGESYQDGDVDAYYCPPCLEVKKQLAQEMDAKRVGVSKKPVISALQEYDNSQKVHGFVHVRL